jgi:hypothetical protein
MQIDRGRALSWRTWLGWFALGERAAHLALGAVGRFGDIQFILQENAEHYPTEAWVLNFLISQWGQSLILAGGFAWIVVFGLRRAPMLGFARQIGLLNELACKAPRWQSA